MPPRHIIGDDSSIADRGKRKGVERALRPHSRQAPPRPRRTLLRDFTRREANYRELRPRHRWNRQRA